MAYSQESSQKPQQTHTKKKTLFFFEGKSLQRSLGEAIQAKHSAALETQLQQMRVTNSYFPGIYCTKQSLTSLW